MAQENNKKNLCNLLEYNEFFYEKQVSIIHYHLILLTEDKRRNLQFRILFIHIYVYYNWVQSHTKMAP